MSTQGLVRATNAKRSTVSTAIEEAKAALSKEHASGELLRAFREHRSNTDRPFLTLAAFLSRTRRSDTGKAVNQRALYKKSRAVTRIEVEQFVCDLEDRLLAELRAGGVPVITRVQELEAENRELKARIAKLRDHLHVAYERERARRRAARHAALADKSKVVSIR